MEAIKQIVRIPREHEIKIKIPRYVPENALMEVILIIEKKPEVFRDRIGELKEAVRDTLFLDDMRDTLDDFKNIDSEEWR